MDGGEGGMSEGTAGCEKLMKRGYGGQDSSRQGESQ